MEKRDIIRGLRVFLVITILATVGILIFTVDRETYRALGRMVPLFLLLALFLSLLHLYLDFLRLQVLTWALGKFISLRSSIEFTMGGLFLTITPFQLGGIPLQIYILKREGFTIGNGTAIVLFRALLGLGVLFVALPGIISYYHIISTAQVLKSILNYLFFFYLIAIVLIMLILFQTERVRKGIHRFGDFLRKRRIVKSDNLRKFVNRTLDEVVNFKRSIPLFFKAGKWKTLLSFFITLISMGVYCLIAPALLYGLGVPVSVVKAAILQLVLTYLLAFVPTPGASGVAELGGFSLFALICPRELLGIYVLLWRFFSFYISVIIGGFVLIRMVGFEKLKKITEKEEGEGTQGKNSKQ
ncbi:MAG: flippase-like domain-containing protein [Candidatus Cloacimonadota bacterium]|nr:MAG: flippase-like domain-containing protein [Candidatus Cloacimonadota bacterium]